MAFTGPMEDRLAIRELIDTYADAVCNFDADAWGATWAHDAEWMLPDVPQIGKIEGQANIVAAWKAGMASFPGIVFSASAGSIEVEGDRAQVRSYTSEVYDKDGISHRVRGRYDDVLVKRQGRWLFKTRIFKSIHRGL